MEALACDGVLPPFAKDRFWIPLNREGTTSYIKRPLSLNKESDLETIGKRMRLPYDLEHRPFGYRSGRSKTLSF